MARSAGRPLRLGGTRQRALLAILLLHANEMLSVDRLIAEVWGTVPPDTALKMIRNNVSRLRSLLDSGTALAPQLVTHPGGYELRIDPDQVDSRRFERLVQEGGRALAAGDAETASAKLQEGLALWRGPALTDFAYEPFADTEATRLEELRLTAIEDRIEADLALGRHADVVGELEALGAQHPLRERLRSHLMLALYRSGRQAEALEVYQRTRQLLVDTLGIEPGRTLQQLERAILVQDSSLDAVERAAPVEAPPVEAPPRVPQREVRKTVSVVFAEIVVLGPRRDPEALRRPLSRTFETAVRVLEGHGGTVERLATGAVTAVFGIPVVHEDDPLRAVRAAVELRDEVTALNEELEQQWRTRVAVRAGVHTGEVVVGDTEVRAGDVIERAARLQQAAGLDEVLAGEKTTQLVGGGVRVSPAARSTSEPAWRVDEVTAGATAIPRRLDLPMIGREQELAQLRHAFERAVRERTPYLFTVLGPAGIGKTRLVTELASSIAGEATVVTGRCPPYGEAITFWPLAEIISELGGDDAGAIADLVATEDDAELIADLVAGAIGLVERPTPTEETFWAVRRLFETLADERPLVVVFEDVHCAEPTLLDLIEHLAEWTRSAPMLIVGLARPELLEDRPSWGGGQLNATSILLGPLSEVESAQFVEQLLGARGMSAETFAGITAAAEGNPLFLEQMLAMLSEDPARDGEVAVPPTIQAVLTARLDRLDPDEREVLERASVVGKEFSRAAVAELSPVDARASVEAHLEGLVHRDLIWPHRSLLPGDAAFRFRHILLRETAYESVPKEVRAELHERFAAWLERAAGARSREFEESVGHHLEQAYRYRSELSPADDRVRELARRAAERLAAAGRRAYARGDLPATVGFLSRAVALPDTKASVRIELLVDLGDALRERGDHARAGSVLVEAAEAASSSGDRALEAHVGIARLRLQLQTDPELKTDDVLRRAKHAVRIFDEAGDERRLAKAWELLAWVPWFRCRAADAEAALLHALEHARRAGDRRTEAQSLNLLVGAAWFGPLPVADAIARCNEILARRTEQRRVKASALRALAGLRAMEGSFDEARRAAADCKAILEDLGLSVTAASATETYAIVELLAGEPAAAERELRRGYEILERMGEAIVTPVLAALLARALYEQGQDEDALRATELSEQGAAPDDLSADVQWRTVRAQILARAGSVAKAEVLAREAAALAEQTDFLVVHGDALAGLAEVLRLGGRPEEADPVLQEALRLYERKGNVVAASRTAALLAERAGVR
ncbi:MAG TPA: BTAD domain-containing putative transcriptional regulator [Gaiellaceae bacterium]